MNKMVAIGLGALMVGTQAHAQLFTQRPPAFTAEQASQGKAAYAGSCMMCHGEDLGGSGAAPALKGADFQAQWRNLRPDGLYAFIVGQMPPNAGGSLDTRAYANITAYIFQANGLASGGRSIRTLPRPASREACRASRASSCAIRPTTP
jgi:mono/diheme cytochrome c family protein